MFTKEILQKMRSLARADFILTAENPATKVRFSTASSMAKACCSMLAVTCTGDISSVAVGMDLVF